MWLKDRDSIVVVARRYDESGRLVGAQIAGNNRVCSAECSAFLVEDALRRLGWMQFEEYSSTKRLDSGHLTFSVFIRPRFHRATRATTKNIAAGKLRTRPYLN
jgi:hypothetical protein